MQQKKTKINKNAKSNLAKLLATENISVEHKKVKTAYFDVKSRLLVLPIWKDMNEDITDLLIAHEVGHALFTPQSGWEDSIIKRKIPKSFLNVIEDARIEKLVKRKYPGIVRSFVNGYRELIDNSYNNHPVEVHIQKSILSFRCFFYAPIPKHQNDTKFGYLHPGSPYFGKAFRFLRNTAYWFSKRALHLYHPDIFFRKPFLVMAYKKNKWSRFQRNTF